MAKARKGDCWQSCISLTDQTRSVGKQARLYIYLTAARGNFTHCNNSDVFRYHIVQDCRPSVDQSILRLLHSSLWPRVTPRASAWVRASSTGSSRRRWEAPFIGWPHNATQRNVTHKVAVALGPSLLACLSLFRPPTRRAWVLGLGYRRGLII